MDPDPFSYLLPLNDLNSIFDDKHALYNYLSRTRFLPSTHSRACSISYLTRVLQNTPGMYVQYRNHPKFYTYKFTRRGSRINLMHEYLENLLIMKGYPKLGFDHPSYRADFSFYANVVLFLEPEDKLGLLGRKEHIAYEIDMTPIMVSDADYKALLALPPLKKASNLVLHTKEDLKRSQRERHKRQMEDLEKSGRIICANLKERAAENLRKLAIMHQSKAYNNANVELLKKRFLDFSLTEPPVEEEKVNPQEEINTDEPGGEFLANIRNAKRRPPKNYKPLRPTMIKDVKFKRYGDPDEGANTGYSNPFGHYQGCNCFQCLPLRDGSSSFSQNGQNSGSSFPSSVIFKRYDPKQPVIIDQEPPRNPEETERIEREEREVHKETGDCICPECLKKAMVPQVSDMLKRLESKLRTQKTNAVLKPLKEEFAKRVEFKRFEAKEERDDGMSAVTRVIFKKYLAEKHIDMSERIESVGKGREEVKERCPNQTSVYENPFLNQENKVFNISEPILNSNQEVLETSSRKDQSECSLRKEGGKEAKNLDTAADDQKIINKILRKLKNGQKINEDVFLLSQSDSQNGKKSNEIQFSGSYFVCGSQKDTLDDFDRPIEIINPTAISIDDQSSNQTSVPLHIPGSTTKSEDNEAKSVPNAIEKGQRSSFQARNLEIIALFEEEEDSIVEDSDQSLFQKLSPFHGYSEKNFLFSLKRPKEKMEFGEKKETPLVLD